MMKSGTSILLDSQIWLWLVRGEVGTATKQAWQTVRHSVTAGSAGVSDVTFWELAIKGETGKLALEPDPRSFLNEARKASRVGVIQADRDILIDSALLVGAHRDPADRILIATALKFDMVLATADRQILDYARRNSRLKVLDVTRFNG